VRAIQSAQRTLTVNAYELTSPLIANAILNRIAAGVQVDVLEEGEPVGKVSPDAIAIRNSIVAAVQRARNGSVSVMQGRAQGVRRFPYDHAKYLVIDSSSVLIGSENYSPTGQPSPGAIGNRGWEVLIHDPVTAANFAKVFSGDRNPVNKDIGVLASFDRLSWSGLEASQWDLAQAETTEDFVINRPAALATGPQTLLASGILPTVSPDTSQATLISLLRAARQTLDLEMLTFSANWGRGGQASPLLNEVVAAAKRGVTVRVLLNDDAAFGGDPTPTGGNNQTATLLNQAAQSGRLKLVAKIANLKAMGVDYIHNKGVLVDGAYTLISSINWDENSVMANREAGVVITSPQINEHYLALFNGDWTASGGR
jgi:phosphatidylserine/phosphatidylglycerophosphate/cardiolipin synthase-like enzyme